MSAKCSTSSSMNSLGPSSDSTEMKPCEEGDDDDDDDDEEEEEEEEETPATATALSFSKPSLLELAICWSNSA